MKSMKGAGAGRPDRPDNQRRRSGCPAPAFFMRFIPFMPFYVVRLTTLRQNGKRFIPDPANQARSFAARTPRTMASAMRSAASAPIIVNGRSGR